MEPHLVLKAFSKGTTNSNSVSNCCRGKKPQAKSDSTPPQSPPENKPSSFNPSLSNSPGESKKPSVVPKLFFKPQTDPAKDAQLPKPNGSESDRPLAQSATSPRKSKHRLLTRSVSEKPKKESPRTVPILQSVGLFPKAPRSSSATTSGILGGGSFYTKKKKKN